MVQIITDSSADLPKDIIEKYFIHVVLICPNRGTRILRGC